jgi:mxaL protein
LIGAAGPGGYRAWLARRGGWPFGLERQGPWLIACLALSAAVFLPPIAMRRNVLEMLVVVDITQSMNTLDGVRDGEPSSRLALVKDALARAVGALPCGSTLGLGVFTEYRTLLLFTPVETCANAHELADAIGHLDGRMAWAGDSQIAKGLDSALRIAKGLPDTPAVVFITDGQEAPPINPRHRPGFSAPGAVAGVIVGVGGARPQPIPKFDPEGRPQGFWGPTEVLQADLYTEGRQGSDQHEAMVESEPAPLPPAALRGSPGAEHLSYLHEEYLQLLASETHLGYHRLGVSGSLAEVLTARSMTRKRIAATDLRWVAGAVALLSLLARYLRPARRGMTGAAG